MSQIPMKVGPWSAHFDCEWGSLRRICYAGHEVLRGLSAPVRDEYWGTVRPKVENIRFSPAGTAAHLVFDVTCIQHAIDFRWHGEITLSTIDGLSFNFDGKAESAFRRNRIGICILHPENCAGSACEVEQADGGWIHGEFPYAISPYQPFTNIVALRHFPASGLNATLRMEGDVFEMEDQRNWTDASFKTYCTPLGRPTPVEVPMGTRVQQGVRLTVESLAHLLGSQERADVVFCHPAGGDRRPVPEVEIGGESPGDLFPNFTEFNRQRPGGERAIRFAMNPQVHAFDDLSLIETLAIQADCVRNALKLAEGRRVETTLSLQPLGKSVDPRWEIPLAGAWMLASLKYVSEAGASLVRVPDQPTVGSAVEQALRDWKRLQGYHIHPVSSSEPISAVGAWFTNPVENLRLTVSLSSKPVRVRWGEENPMTLPPWNWKWEKLA